MKPVCEITKKTRRFFSGKVKVYVSRQCSDEATISWLTQKCTKAGTCPERVTCKESKCMPHLPGISTNNAIDVDCLQSSIFPCVCCGLWHSSMGHHLGYSKRA